MPKTIELTVEIVVQKVSCPGVWLCQDGSVSLIVYALDTNYETCMLPPTFPLKFNDKLYFRKTFHESCALSNIHCLLEEEALYCELVQWSQSCYSVEPKILAQYLGSLSDVLFPPKTCCSDGVDLLMRRCKNYPGILSPKIEIATKVRIDEVWNDNKSMPYPIPKLRTCHCTAHTEYSRQKSVCHSTQYHRNKCPSRPRSKSKSCSRSRSRESASCTSLKNQIQENFQCARSEDKEQEVDYNEDKKVLLESRYIDDEKSENCEDKRNYRNKYTHDAIKPCICEICRRYHELFNVDCS